MPRRRYIRRRRTARFPVYKTVESVALALGGTAGLLGNHIVVNGPCVFMGATLSFTLQSKSIEGGNGWLTIAFVRATTNTIGSTGGMEAFEARDILHFKNFPLYKVQGSKRYSSLVSSMHRVHCQVMMLKFQCDVTKRKGTVTYWPIEFHAKDGGSLNSQGMVKDVGISLFAKTLNEQLKAAFRKVM